MNSFFWWYKQHTVSSDVLEPSKVLFPPHPDKRRHIAIRMAERMIVLFVIRSKTPTQNGSSKYTVRLAFISPDYTPLFTIAAY